MHEFWFETETIVSKIKQSHRIAISIIIDKLITLNKMKATFTADFAAYSSNTTLKWFSNV